jgi:hypothetical protein
VLCRTNDGMARHDFGRGQLPRFLFLTGRPFAFKTSDDRRFPSNVDVATYRLRTLLALVILQCVLYGINLKLLPMWGDETFTVATAAETPARIIQIVREDIHPPLYFLLTHWWNRIPISTDPLLRLRALSP